MSKLTVFEYTPARLAYEMRILGLDVELERLRASGVHLVRFNWKDHRASFAKYPQVVAEMGKGGEFLPIFLLDERIVSKAVYPTSAQLEQWTQLPMSAAG